MIQDLRTRYNAAFTEERYQNFLQDIYSRFHHIPGFRIAETPVFIPAHLREKIFEACHQISDAILRPDFKTITDPSLTGGNRVPGEDAHTTFLQMDFGLCEGPDGEIVPKLIEVQGFPSLYGYQHFVAGIYRNHFDIPDNLHHLFNGFDELSYEKLLRDTIIGDADPKETVLIDIEPFKQTTQIDFHATRKMMGLHVACATDLYQRGNKLYYRDDTGREIQIKRVYNRVIFDELSARNDLELRFSFHDDLDVYWVGHPNWFFRISKYTMPNIDCKYMPSTRFLSDIDQLPDDLENYVLKPLYSFSGSGVIFHVTREDIDKVEDPTQYILQEKVKYVPVIQTPDNDPVKVEIRIMHIWPENEPRPLLVNNLARLSKGEMIGVKFNKDKTWVGGSVGFFE